MVPLKSLPLEHHCDDNSEHGEGDDLLDDLLKEAALWLLLSLRFCYSFVESLYFFSASGYTEGTVRRDA